MQGLLTGELRDTAEFAYDFDAWHLGVTAVGEGAADALRTVGAAIDCRVLLVPRGDQTVWAWFGARRRLDPSTLTRLAASRWPTEIAAAVGEPGEGLTSWRLTHRQANAALPIALRGSPRVVRYADVALQASLLRDDLLAASLRESYIAPLATERDGGKALRETLRAYFIAGRNVSSAAAALGVSRQAVGSRLRTAEERIRCSLDSCAVELELALRNEDLGDTSAEADLGLSHRQGEAHM